MIVEFVRDLKEAKFSIFDIDSTPSRRHNGVLSTSKVENSSFGDPFWPLFQDKMCYCFDIDVGIFHCEEIGANVTLECLRW